MNNIRLLPVVVVAITALLVLKTLGLVTNGGYVLGGIATVQAEGKAPAQEASPAPEGEQGSPGEVTISDTSPTLVDENPTLADTSAEGEAEGSDSEQGEGEATSEEAEAPAEEGGAEAESEGEPSASTSATVETACVEADASIAEDGTVTLNEAAAEEGSAEAAAEGESSEAPAEAAPSFAASMTNCLPSGDAIAVQIDGKGSATPLTDANGTSLSEQQLLERLASRRTELEKYEQDLALRSSIVDAAEKRIEERTATLQALEAQISTLVDQRTEMESGQFAGIVAMYETMKPKDAAAIFNNLDMEVLLRVAKTMSPRKMAPILAVMDTARAQELTVKMAALAEQPAAEMTPDDLAALPQIVGQ